MQRKFTAIIASLVFLAACAIPVSAEVVLGLEFSASPDPVIPGGVLSYTIMATNSGDETSSPTILFGFDPNLEYLSASPVSNQELLGDVVTSPAFWFTTSDPEPERTIQIPPGGSYAITVLTQVKADVPCDPPTSVTSTATVRDPGNGGGPTSVTETLTIPVTCAIPAPEFPSPVLPATMLVLLSVGILFLRSRAG